MKSVNSLAASVPRDGFPLGPPAYHVRQPVLKKLAFSKHVENEEFTFVCPVDFILNLECESQWGNIANAEIKVPFAESEPMAIKESVFIFKT